jgi:hypothetical protein
MMRTTVFSTALILADFGFFGASVKQFSSWDNNDPDSPPSRLPPIEVARDR